MKILLPFKKEQNPYLNEIINHSEHTFLYDNYLNFNPTYDVVNIHWPEALFDWKEPTSAELDVLEGCINIWKRNALIVYTKHDYQRNKGTSINFTRLFELIEINTDVFIHLGEYSKRFYEKKLPKAKHEIVYHPIFKNSYEVYPKTAARNSLRIDSKALVVIAPGKIRSFKERNMVLKSFKALKIENKVLISTHMRTELRFDFPGRVRLKRYFDIQNFIMRRFKESHLSPQYMFNYNTMSSKDLSLRMSSADIVLVPRMDLLNSGIVFLGMTFGKVIVGPAIGNIEEQLKELNFPVFNPNSLSSVTEALEKGIKINLCRNYIKKPLAKYLPLNIAKEFDRILFKVHKA